MLNALEITRLHDQATLRWHEDEPWPDPATLAQLKDVAPPQTPGRPRGSRTQPSIPEALLELVLTHHRINFDLWQPARRWRPREPGSPDAAIAQVKRNIDKLNQNRNDLIEAMDHVLLAAAGRQKSAAPLNSESPGLMLDRLSILALKVYRPLGERGPAAPRRPRPTASATATDSPSWKTSAPTSPAALTRSGKRRSPASDASNSTAR